MLGEGIKKIGFFNSTELVNCPSRMMGKFEAVNTHSHKYYPIRSNIP
jgi:hypothetical protein